MKGDRHMSETKGLAVKGSSAKFCLVPVLIAGAGLLLTANARAQIFTTLHHFTAASGSLYTNSDGANPSSGLIVSGSTLYGTASYGGTAGNGTVFRLNIDGTGFTNLHNFTATSGPLGTNSDGADPYGALVLAGNSLYGTTESGGVAGNGTIFKVNIDGTGFGTLHSFTATPADPPWTNSDGSSGNGGLIVLGNTLYGTASYGGSAGNGTLFAININGTGFTNLHSFSAGIGNWPDVTNSEGAFPNGMILSGSTFYGTAGSGGGAANGTVFAISTNGTGVTTLHSFTAAPGIGPTNNDGVGPHGLLLSGSMLYGTANLGGSSSYGTVFALNTNATGFTNLHSFPSARFSTNSDGAYPNDGLVLLGNTLYGTAGSGGRFINVPGSPGNGTLFAVAADGTGFTNLHDFSAAPYETNSDGFYPNGELVAVGNDLYGTTDGGGDSKNGTVFKFSLVNVPTLSLVPYGLNVVLFWPTNAVGFSLQFTTNLVSPAVWKAVTPGPIIIGDQKVVIDSAPSPRKFYRLSR